MIDPSFSINQALYSTVKINCGNSEGHGTGTGTIFGFEWNRDWGTTVIVTNKHVIEGSDVGYISFHEGGKRPDGTPFPTEESSSVKFDNFSTMWIRHPDDKVDLAIMPLSSGGMGDPYYWVSIPDTMVPTQSMLDELLATEEVIITGYPLALSDVKNNFPILRRGITASHPAYEYNGKPVGLVDAGIQTGSSGSSVMLYNPTSFLTKQKITIGTRFLFLGIVSAMFTAYENVGNEFLDVPTDTSKLVSANLGMYIQAKKLMDFKPILRGMLKEKGFKVD